MYRSHIMLAALCLPVLPAAWAQGDNEGSSHVKRETQPVEIGLISVTLRDKMLELSYQIKNTSAYDIWVCEGFNPGYRSFELDMARDTQTLIMRRRLNVPRIGFRPDLPFGCYSRLRKGDMKKESLSLSLPLRPYHVLFGGRRPVRAIEHARCLWIEIGFYSGDLPAMIFGLLEEAEKDPQKKHVGDRGYPTDVIGWLDSSVYFNSINESIADREERVVVPWTNQTLEGEQTIRATADDVNIPYLEDAGPIEFRPLNLDLCTRIEITYEPSLFEYLFPYPSQQSLLNAGETKYLQSEKKIVSHNRQSIRVLTDELREGILDGTVVAECSRGAHVVCYNGNKRLIAFTLCDESTIVTTEGQCFWYRDGLQSIRVHTSQIKQATPFSLRVDCAANLKRLWYRLHLYHKAKQTRYTDEGMTEFAEPIPPQYPAPDRWCDSLVQAYVPLGGSAAYILESHKCPSADEGKSHYAMNPNCKPDSPADMVLLFETKGGWNQQGEPELFTFDNHDPKGGCVLLNDGTVKFIRTKEELQQLRWK